MTRTTRHPHDERERQARIARRRSLFSEEEREAMREAMSLATVRPYQVPANPPDTAPNREVTL